MADRKKQNRSKVPHVVIFGGGFGGLYAAKALAKMPVQVTLIDKRNFHLFQPLLYQVATGGLSPGDISSPLRAIFSKKKNIRVLCGEVVDFKPDDNEIILRNGHLHYDYLILAAGSQSFYFNHDEWEKSAPYLKTIEDALDIRSHIFNAFEKAEIEENPGIRKEWMTFVIAGGGPTGVELAGAMRELCRETLKNDFRHINTADAVIWLIEGRDRVLSSYPEKLSRKTQATLEEMGVKVKTGSLVSDIKGNEVTVKSGDQEEKIYCRTVLWAAGVKASSLSDALAEQTRCETDKAGRVKVDKDFAVPKHENIFVIGDMAYYEDEQGNMLPGLAPVAMQEGKYVADIINRRVKNDRKPVKPFRYRDKGNLAVIGRNSAAAWFGKFRIFGFFAWLVWVFVHIGYLIEYDNKLIVLLQWSWNYFTRKKGARLITGREVQPEKLPEINGVMVEK